MTSEQYFNHRLVSKEVAELRQNILPAGKEISLSVPGAVRKMVRDEAFYCRVSEVDMPSRMVLHGAAIGALAAKDTHIDFEHGSAARLLPFNFPLPREIERITQLYDGMIKASDDMYEISLDPSANALLEAQCENNGIAPTLNFVAYAGLINYIGVAEREGLSLTIYGSEPVAAP